MVKYFNVIKLYVIPKHKCIVSWTGLMKYIFMKWLNFNDVFGKEVFLINVNFEFNSIDIKKNILTLMRIFFFKENENVIDTDYIC